MEVDCLMSESRVWTVYHCIVNMFGIQDFSSSLLGIGLWCRANVINPFSDCIRQYRCCRNLQVYFLQTLFKRTWIYKVGSPMCCIEVRPDYNMTININYNEVRVITGATTQCLGVLGTDVHSSFAYFFCNFFLNVDIDKLMTSQSLLSQQHRVVILVTVVSSSTP